MSLKLRWPPGKVAIAVTGLAFACACAAIVGALWMHWYPSQWESAAQRARVGLGLEPEVKFTINLQARGCYLIDPEGVRYMVDADVTQVPLVKGWRLTRECFKLAPGVKFPAASESGTGSNG